MPDAIVDTSVLIATEKLGIQNLIAKVYDHIIAPDFNAYSHAQRLRGIGFRIGDALLETIRRKGV